MIDKDSKMKIMIGICTYNRKEIFEKSANSLKRINEFDSIDVCVFDDCSTDYDVEYIKSLLPTAIVLRRDNNVGPGKNALMMYNYFIDSDSDILINADSDLLYRKDLIDTVRKYIPEHCFFSLFNTDNHPVIGEYDDVFVEKENVGAAGCCMTKEIAILILDNIKIKDDLFDFVFCEILKSNGIKILSLKQSMVQHIGYYGYNSNHEVFDYGTNYDVDTFEDAKVIIDILEKAYKMCCKEKNSRLSRKLTKPFRKTRRHMAYVQRIIRR